MADIESDKTQAPSAGPIRVVLVDDHAMVREGLCAVIERHHALQVVGEAATGQDAIKLARSLQPDVMVMDVSMPGVSGIEATRQITHELPSIAVVGLSFMDDRATKRVMRDAGAVGYVTKQSAAQDLCQAIHDAVRVKPGT